MNIARILTVGVLGLGMSLGLRAQETKPFSAGLNYVLPLDALKTVTNSGAFGGFHADFNYTAELANSGMLFRASLGLGYFPGKEKDGLKTNLAHGQLAGDILTDLSADKKLTLITGLSVNHWRAFNHVSDPAIDENRIVWGQKGVKLGGRLGLTYRVNAQWSASALLQVVEFGMDKEGAAGINPSWIEVGAKYHF